MSRSKGGRAARRARQERALERRKKELQYLLEEKGFLKTRSAGPSVELEAGLRRSIGMEVDMRLLEIALHESDNREKNGMIRTIDRKIQEVMKDIATLEKILYASKA